MLKISKEKFEICLANKGLLFTEFCQQADVNKASIRLALSGKRESRPKTVGKIAKTLEVSVEEIIVKEGENIENVKE